MSMFEGKKAKFDWIDDYSHSRWQLMELEGQPDYEIAPGFEMPVEFVERWFKANKALEALEDELNEEQAIRYPVEMAVCSVCGEQYRVEQMTEIGLGSNVYECDKCWYTTGGEPLEEETNE